MSWRTMARFQDPGVPLFDCPNWNFRSEKWKFTVKWMNSFGVSAKPTIATLTSVHVKTFTRCNFPSAVRLLICSSSCLNTEIHLSFWIWLQIFLCICGISFNLFAFSRTESFWVFSTQIWPFLDCLNGKIQIYLSGDCHLPRGFQNKALCAEIKLISLRVAVFERADQIWATKRWNSAVFHWIECYSSSNHRVSRSAGMSVRPIRVPGSWCVWDSEMALQKSGSAESLGEEYCFSLFQHSRASSSF